MAEIVISNVTLRGSQGGTYVFGPPIRANELFDCEIVVVHVETASGLRSQPGTAGGANASVCDQDEIVQVARLEIAQCAWSLRGDDDVM